MFGSPSSEYRELLITGGLLAFTGWIGLALLVQFTLPTVGPRWLFFFLLALAATGSALPFITFLHRRFGPPQLAPAGTLLRQSLLVALFTELCVWLQMNRSLNLSLALLLGACMVAIDWFLRILNRSGRRSKS